MNVDGRKIPKSYASMYDCMREFIEKKRKIISPSKPTGKEYSQTTNQEKENNAGGCLEFGRKKGAEA